MRGIKLTKKFDYEDEAKRTISFDFYAGNVTTIEMLDALRDFINAAEKLDVLKKRIFYGKNLNVDLHDIYVKNPETFLHHEKRLWTEQEQLLLHGIIGVATEAGELVENLLEGVREKVSGNEAPFDLVNIVEENGDVFWYQNLLAIACNTCFENVQHINIAKLKKRYPEKFTCDKAINRDVKAERALLEKESK